MTIIARDLSPMLPFTWSPEGEEVVFKLRALTTADLIDLQGVANLDKEQETMRWNRRAVQLVLAAGMLGWEGFNDATGLPVEFGKKAADNIERMGIMLTMQIFMQIMGATGLNVEQAKN